MPSSRFPQTYPLLFMLANKHFMQISKFSIRLKDWLMRIWLKINQNLSLTALILKQRRGNFSRQIIEQNFFLFSFSLSVEKFNIKNETFLIKIVHESRWKFSTCRFLGLFLNFKLLSHFLTSKSRRKNLMFLRWQISLISFQRNLCNRM